MDLRLVGLELGCCWTCYNTAIIIVVIVMIIIKITETKLQRQIQGGK